MFCIIGIGETRGEEMKALSDPSTEDIKRIRESNIHHLKFLLSCPDQEK